MNIPNMYIKWKCYCKLCILLYDTVTFVRLRSQELFGKDNVAAVVASLINFAEPYSKSINYYLLLTCMCTRVCLYLFVKSWGKC